jgi:hypothetical protein
MRAALIPILTPRKPVTGFSQVKLSLEQDSSNVSMLVMGDSTGDQTTEWVYLFASWLAAQYPKFSVNYYLWDGTNRVWSVATVLSTGTGSHTLNFWNGSVAGTSPIYHMGANFTAAIVTPAPGVIIWSHGENLAGFASGVVRGEFIGAIDQTKIGYPNVPHVLVKQNPRRDDNNMAVVIDQINELSQDYSDISLVDVYSSFLSLQKASSLYADNIHPNAAGEQLYLAAVQRAWNATRTSGVLTPAPAFLSTSGTNLLSNSDFSNASYVGGTPTGWTASASPTCTVETTIKAPGKSQSLKMTGVTGQGLIRFSLGAPAIAALVGKTVTLAVRQYVPSGQATTVGQIGVLVQNPLVSTTAVRGTQGVDGWRWYCLSEVAIPVGTTSVSFSLGCDAAANTTSTVYYDSAIAVEGKFPRNL